MTKSLENNTPHWGMHLTAQHGKEVKKGKRKRAPRIERESKFIRRKFDEAGLEF